MLGLFHIAIAQISLLTLHEVISVAELRNNNSQYVICFFVSLDKFSSKNIERQAYLI